MTAILCPYERGEVVGSPNSQGLDLHPTLWRTRKPTDLGLVAGTSEGEADGINDLGQIVGTNWVTDSQYNKALMRAVLWSGGKKTMLPGPISAYAGADEVDNHSQIIGWARSKSGKDHAVLWTLKR